MRISKDYHVLVRYLRKAVFLSERIGDRVAQREIGVGRASFLILRAISETTKSPSQQMLAKQLSLTKGGVSRQIAFLQKAGFLKVEESSVSRRENSLNLTQKGHDLVQAGSAAQARLEGSIFKRLRVGDVAATVRVLRVFCDHLEAEERK